MDETLAGTTIPSQSEPGSNGNEAILYIPQSSRDSAFRLQMGQWQI